MSGRPCAVDRHRALALGGAADGGDLAGGGRAAAQQPPGRRHQTVPPVVGALLGAAAGQHVQRDRLALPAGHAAVDRDQRGLDAGRAEVDGQDVPCRPPRRTETPDSPRPPCRAPGTGFMRGSIHRVPTRGRPAAGVRRRLASRHGPADGIRRRGDGCDQKPDDRPARATLLRRALTRRRRSRLTSTPSILHAAPCERPPAGNLMLYSIIEVDDPTLKARLAEHLRRPALHRARRRCVLVFVADLQKWVDLFAVGRLRPARGTCRLDVGAPHGRLRPGLLRRPDRGPERGRRGRVAGHRLAATSATSSSAPRPTPSCCDCRATRSPSRCSASAGPKAAARDRAIRAARGPRDGYRRLSATELATCRATWTASTASTASARPRAPSRTSSGASSTTDFSAEADRSVAWWIERWMARD